MEAIRVKRIKDDAIMPTYGSAEAAGADLYACLSAPVTIQPGESVFIPTGLAMELPRGYAGLIYARSGLACKRGLAPANKVGVVDSDYRGEFMIVLHNHGDAAQTIEHGEGLPNWSLHRSLLPALPKWRNYLIRSVPAEALALQVNNF